MKLSSPLFFVFSTVVGTALIAAEPCLPGDNNSQGFANNGYGAYDMTACNYCAKSGKGHGECCDSIYRHSSGRDDDDFFQTENDGVDCADVNDGCIVGEGQCYPGLTCGAAKTCQLKTDDPNAHPATCDPQCGPGTFCSEALTCTVNGAHLEYVNDVGQQVELLGEKERNKDTTTTKGDPSFVFVVVGLLGAAMLALKVVLQRRHRGLLRRHQYNEVDATATRIDV